MNRPPFPTTLSAKRTRRQGQNLTSLAPGSRAAVLLPVIPRIPQSQSWILVKRTDVSGEGGQNFILHHFLLEVLHPPRRPNRGKRIPLVNRDARRHRKINHQNGRERPHFSGFQPPKKFWGSLPPTLPQSRMCERPEGALGERVIACAVHLSVHLYVHSATGVSHSVLKLSFNPVSASRTSSKHRVGLERPPLRCHRTGGGRSSPTDVHHYNAYYRTMRGCTESRMTASIAGPQEGEPRNASPESTTETNSKCDDSGPR